MMSPQDRYKQDAEFRHLVDLMESMIRKCRFTPTEIREAAMLAAIQYELRDGHTVIHGYGGPSALIRSLYAQEHTMPRAQEFVRRVHGEWNSGEDSKA